MRFLKSLDTIKDGITITLFLLLISFVLLNITFGCSRNNLPSPISTNPTNPDSTNDDGGVREIKRKSDPRS